LVALCCAIRKKPRRPKAPEATQRPRGPKGRSKIAKELRWRRKSYQKGPKEYI
jgi:hypothetical protein